MAESVFSWSMLVFILGLAALFIFALILLSPVRANLSIDFIYKWINGAGSAAPEAITLENALQCSFDRCAYGCNSDEVKKLQYSKNGIFFDCTQFCKQEWTDTRTIDGKICDDNSKAHPVTATVVSTGGEKISLDKMPIFVCITETDGCTSSTETPKYIYIDKNSVVGNYETKACRLGNIVVNGASSLVVNVGPYKIWTSSYSVISGGQSTHLCGT